MKYDFSKIKKYFFTNLESAHSPDKTDNAIDLYILAEQSSGCESEEQYTLYVHVHHIKKWIKVLCEIFWYQLCNVWKNISLSNL